MELALVSTKNISEFQNALNRHMDLHSVTKKNKLVLYRKMGATRAHHSKKNELDSEKMNTECFLPYMESDFSK